MIVGGPTVRSPDSAYSIRPVRSRFEKDDGTQGNVLGIDVGEGSRFHPVQNILWDEGETEMLWGPSGSGFAVIRCRNARGDHFMALDLRRGQWLREEW